MSDDRKKPVWQLIVALLIGLPVLYVASFGPACWAVANGKIAARPVARVYWPVLRLVRDSGPRRSLAVACAGIGTHDAEFTVRRLLDAARLKKFGTHQSPARHPLHQTTVVGSVTLSRSQSLGRDQT